MDIMIYSANLDVNDSYIPASYILHFGFKLSLLATRLWSS